MAGVDFTSQWIHTYSTSSPAEGTSVRQNDFVTEGTGHNLAFLIEDAGNTVYHILPKVDTNPGTSYVVSGMCVSEIASQGTYVMEAGFDTRGIALTQYENVDFEPAAEEIADADLTTTGNVTVDNLIKLQHNSYNLSGSFDGTMRFKPNDTTATSFTVESGENGLFTANYNPTNSHSGTSFGQDIENSAYGYAMGFTTLNNVATCSMGGEIVVMSSGNPARTINYNYDAGYTSGSLDLKIPTGTNTFFSFMLDSSSLFPINSAKLFNSSDIPGTFTPRQCVSHNSRVYVIGDNGATSNPTEARLTTFVPSGPGDIGTLKLTATAPDYVYGSGLTVYNNLIAAVFNYNGTVTVKHGDDTSTGVTYTTSSPRSILLVWDCTDPTVFKTVSYPTGNDTFFTTGRIKADYPNIYLSGSVSSTTSSTMFDKSFTTTGSNSMWIISLDIDS